MRIFGYEFNVSKAEKRKEEFPSFVPPVTDDGAVTVMAASGYSGTYIDLEGSAKNEAELVTKYRSMARHPEVDSAVGQIANEAIVQEDDQDIVDIVLDDLKEVPENVKKAITSEFEQVLELLEWNTHAKDIFQRWYVDGRIYYHAIIDEKNTEEGIQELRYIDPRKIRKVREVTPKVDPALQKIPGAEMITAVKQEYFVFNPRGFVSNSNPTYSYSTAPATGLRIAKDAIVHVTSGLTDSNNSLVLSHLHKAIRYLNQFRALEDAAIIYRLARAPERRIFYIDTGALPRHKAEQYIKELMTKHKNKLVYDGATGEIRDDRKMMTMMEDYWIPRREGGKGTEVTTLPPGNAQGILEELDFFKQRLYASLNVPYARTNPDALFPGSDSMEISRDEVTFSKFIDNVRMRFNLLFLSILEKQLVLKKIIMPEDWKLIQYRIQFKYARDNLFAEIKDRQIWMGRLNFMQLLAPYVGRYVSNEWVLKQVFRFTESEIEEVNLQIMKELQNPLYQGPPGMAPQQMGDDGIPEPNPAQDPDNAGLSAGQDIASQKPINKPRKVA